MITGIRVGHGDTLPWTSTYCHEDLERLLGRRYHPSIRCDAYSLDLCRLYAFFSGSDLDDTDIELDCIARAFIFFAMGSVFFSTTDSGFRIGYLAVLEDLAHLDRYDLEGAIMS
ncbi:hypothetical protein BVC80_1341g16 [Macleaya cordata]|uniref:Uncharacterized protein n=1 Tax=Macleaya cordata TaxID=56857 RepID=A0A200QKK5_MACCD|nr:hypothetical protein BVC80_1341g16 [Macleaya cordata]